MEKLNGLKELSAALPKPAATPVIEVQPEKPKRTLPTHLKKYQFKPGTKR